MEIKDIFKTLLILVLIVIYSCSRPLPVNKLHEHKTYVDINEALSNPTDVYMLHLDDTLSIIDINDLVKLNKIQRLDISSKINIDTFPGKLTILRNLQWIKIKNNHIEVIDFQVQHFPYLEILELSNNEIEEFPIWLCSKENKYYSIDLSNNQIIEISRDIGNLNNLNHLNLSDNQIKQLPLEIGELKKLTTLNLMNNNLTELPYTVSNLYSNLEKLFIGGNKIGEEHLNWLKKHLPYTDIDTNIYEK